MQNMAQKVTKDTFAVEQLEGGGELRRMVFAGAVVPDSWELEEGGEEVEEESSVAGEEPAEPKPVESRSTRRSKS
jgi:hypothetical protein